MTHYYHIMSSAIFYQLSVVLLCLTVYKVLNNVAPVYLKSLFHIYQYVPSNDSLRSASDNLRIVTDEGCDKTISSKMCIAWNSLPLNLHACPSFEIFRKNLKTFCFKIVFKK